MHDNWSRVADIGVGLRERGHPVLLFDLRGHGQSDPARLTMGRAERADLRAVLAWARRAGFPPEQIGWLGQSMGASTILLEGLDNQEIRCAVLDSPYGDLPKLLNVQLTLHSGLPSIFNPGILLAAHRAYGVRTDDLVPQRLASSWGDRPLLLIHGEKDTIVPVEQGRAIARAVGPACELITLPGVEHIEGFQSQPELYLDAVDRFFRRALPASPPDQPAQPLPMAG
jgi:pimeloyl-ACP methyl ester carboxylesterase